MAAIRSAENRTEVALRRALHARGLRYRKYATHLPGRPDLVFAGPKVAVFVDGDYWHARVLVEGGLRALAARLRRLPPEARGYWREKFTRRLARDRAVTAELEAVGWCVVRLWESDVKADLGAAVEAVAGHVARRRSPLRGKR